MTKNLLRLSMLKMTISIFLLGLSFTSLALPKFTGISKFGSYVCGHDDSKVFCWGENRYDQVRSLDSFLQIKQIETSERYACALDSQGVLCWGSGSPTPPPEMETSTNITKIQAIRENICANVAGKIVCSDKRPGVMPEGLDHITDFSASDTYLTDFPLKGGGVSCVVQDAKLLCWGEGKGYLKFKNSIPADLGQVLRIEMSEDWYSGIRACILNTQNKIICWGSDYIKKVPAYDEKIIDIKVSSNLNCFTVSSGKVSCWGENIYFKDPQDSFISVSSFRKSACGIDSSGQALCWGEIPDLLKTPPPSIEFKKLVFYDVANNSTYFYIGDEIVVTGYDRFPNVRAKNLSYLAADNGNLCYVADSVLQCKGSLGAIPGDIKNVKDIAMTDESACALTFDQELKCWGGRRSTLSPPSDIKKVRKIISSHGGYCALTDQNELRCWGDSAELTNTNLGSQVQDLAGNQKYSCLLFENDEIRCKDLDSRILIENAPNHLVGTKGLITTFYSPCAYTESEVVCWGLTESLRNPPKVEGKIRSIKAGTSHVCFQDDVSLKCWGDNSLGQYQFWQE